jgi:hypothetical protein
MNQVARQVLFASYNATRLANMRPENTTVSANGSLGVNSPTVFIWISEQFCPVHCTKAAAQPMRGRTGRASASNFTEATPST